MLCASAYAANDYYLLGMYKNKCYKWAYFTEVNDIDINKILQDKRQKRIKIMWCSRFIDWKHPELIVKLASKLKRDGYDFEINMFGNGPLIEDIKDKINECSLTDCVCVKGSVQNNEILSQMRQHNVFIFTSDQNEGWGAVANEAMSNGCTLVGSDAIGSVPFLVKDGKNGFSFRSKDVNSLYGKIKILLDDRKLCEEFAKKAYADMKNCWSPQQAAIRFVNLSKSLQGETCIHYTEGPCSLATPHKL